MSLHERTSSTNRYPEFLDLNPNFSDNTLLDFGGNHGNLLHFAQGDISQEKYTSIDIQQDSIIAGQAEFPDATFQWWNRYNEVYHPSGNAAEPFPTIPQHDYVWAYAVFSHTSFEDMLEVLLGLRSVSAQRIVVSYLCNDGDEKANAVLDYFYNKRVSHYGECVDFRNNSDNYFYLSNNEYGLRVARHVLAVYNTQWLIAELASHGIIASKIHSVHSGIPFLEISFSS